MVTRALVIFALLTAAFPACAAETSPLFGSATQEPVQIAVDPHTGLPVVAEAQKTQAVVATRQ
jgi:hypothetical protein